VESSIEKERLKFKLPPIYFIFVAVIIAIAIWIITALTGIIEVEDLILNFLGFISMLVAITMLAILGAGFLGMYISYRILSKKGFTPFEISMLEMYDEVHKINERLDKIESKLENPKKKKK
jgi:hypothetical protein